jgi:maltose O-acetyltransferase
MMGEDVILITSTHGHDNLNIPMILQESHNFPIKIEDDVWIGDRVIILPGVTIGTGSIIGAGAVVTNDVDAFSVVGGVPARVIRSRKW